VNRFFSFGQRSWIAVTLSGAPKLLKMSAVVRLIIGSRPRV
jgi:hypothetical protein